MPTLTAQQIAQVAHGAGFRGQALRMAVAVALLESGGRTDAHGDVNNPRAGCGSYGLWQINSCPRYGRGHPRWEGEPERLYDPATAARAAFTISAGGSNWRPWSVYKSGKAQKLEPTLQLAPTLDGSNPGTLPDSSSPSATATATATEAAPAGGKLDLTAGSTWLRVGYFLLGLVALVVALVVLAGDSITKELTP